MAGRVEQREHGSRRFKMVSGHINRDATCPLALLLVQHPRKRKGCFASRLGVTNESAHGSVKLTNVILGIIRTFAASWEAHSPNHIASVP